MWIKKSTGVPIWKTTLNYKKYIFPNFVYLYNEYIILSCIYLSEFRSSRICKIARVCVETIVKPLFFFSTEHFPNSMSHLWARGEMPIQCVSGGGVLPWKLYTRTNYNIKTYIYKVLCIRVFVCKSIIII